MNPLWIAAALIAAWFVVTRLRGRISGQQARALISSGARLIDVRSPAEFASGHLEAARNIPVGELGQRAGELGGKDGPLVLYCASGMRSAAAASILRRHGFTQVNDLGSMSRWG